MMEDNEEEELDDLASLIGDEDLLIDYKNNNADDGLLKERIGLKRQVNLLSSVSLMIGMIIGSGIFATPRNVALYAGSTGSILLVWVATGIISTMAGLTWSELGTMFPNQSGCEYSYVFESFGPLPAFMVLFTMVVALQSCGLAMVSIVCGEYILTAFGNNEPLYSKLIAATVIVIVSIVNSASMTWATRFQNVFTVAKLIGINLLIVTGLVRLAQGHNENFIDAFNGTETDVSKLSFAFYGGLFSYNGWNAANFIVAESTNPTRDIPLTILIGMPLIIFCYVMTNVAYLTVLTPSQISNSGAVAVTLANQLYGKMAWVMPIFVALSVIGSVNGGVLVSGRLIYAGAQKGHMPKLLSMLHSSRRTPIPAILCNSFIALLILIPKSSTFVTLTNYFSFSVWMFYSWTTLGLLRLRYKRPNMKRPFKVFIGVPIVLFFCSVYLVVAPFYANPMGSFWCLLFILCSIPVYYSFVKYTILPVSVLNLYSKITKKLQQTFSLVMPELELDEVGSLPDNLESLELSDDEDG